MQIIAKCGNRCDICPAYKENIGRYSKETISAKWQQYFGFYLPPDQIECVGCQREGYHPSIGCKIRKCCMDKDYKTCAECNAFTCELLKNNADAVNDLVKKYSVIPKEDYDLYIKPYLIMETLYNQRKNGGNMKNIELIEEAARPVIYIRTHTSVEKLPQVIGESYRKIASYLQSLGEQPTCVPYTEYYNLDMQNLDVEMGFPVARMLNGQGEIKAREIPSGRFVAYMHIGPYSQMEEPYREIEKWIQEKGLEKTGECYEYYYNSPQEVPESELKTKIMIPVKG